MTNDDEGKDCASPADDPGSRNDDTTTPLICSPQGSRQSGSMPDTPGLAQRIEEFLATEGIAVPAARLQSFAAQLDDCTRRQRARRRFMAGGATRAPLDILRLIHDAMQSGEPSARDEALWRVFLAVHFGYPSSESEQSTSSAGRFLCAFAEEPYWTWTRISTDLASFATWLGAHEGELQTLRYGNHRKFESKHAHGIYTVIASFVAWVQGHGGTPTVAFAVPSDADVYGAFQLLYDLMESLRRFGRTARFDLLTFTTDIGILNVEPDSCHLDGATGPYVGGVLLCGTRPTQELTAIVDGLARHCGMTMGVMEDALCIWQK